MDPVVEFFRRLFVSDFMPRGHCYYWQPALVWLNTVSDALIVLAFYSIPLILVFFLRGRPGLKLNGVILLFGALVLACGTTHLMSIWDLWHSTYRLEGVIKAITAVLAVTTAIVSAKLLPAAQKVPLPEELAQLNSELKAEVAARKAAEEKLIRLMESEREASERLLQEYFEGAPQAILGMESDGRIAVANRRAEEMFAYSREELLGQNMTLLIPERFREAHGAAQKWFFEAPRARHFGEDMGLAGLRKDGSEFPVEMSQSAVSRRGKILAIVRIVDITGRMQRRARLERANTELAAREAELRSYLESAPQGIVAISSDGCIEMVNRRLEEMFGYGRQELLGLDVDILLPERYRPAHAGHRRNYFAEPRMRPMGVGMTLAGRRKDGSEFPVEIGLGHVPGEQGGLGLGLISDITERHRMEAELARVNSELVRSNTELAQFAYVASHDLQEPLRIITGYLQLLERRHQGDLAPEAVEFIEYAVDGATRMKRLIEDLLRLSRAGTQAIQMKAVESASVLATACANLGLSIQDSGARIDRGELPQVVADSGLLTQVFENLIGNALKFHKKDVPPRIRVWAEKHPEGWVFAVQDNGIGIEPQHRERVFGIFERLHSGDSYSGSGIGLAICQRILERHGGRIWVESAEGGGSVFHFALPDRVRPGDAA